MSFASYKDEIEQGDTVILYLSVNSMHAIEVQPRIRNRKEELVENVFQTTYGALKVKSLIGKRFGSKVALSRGWAYVLHPTPELWTLTLPHRTQIIYTPDISMILLQLELRPGSVVVESGTGSGSLSHALIRSIQPDGHLHTFDFHAHRTSVAQGEFEAHGLGSLVSVEQRDVCRDGFGSALDGVADAVFLDLPHPWEAVVHVRKAIKETGGRFVSFSPCIEQVQRTCEELAKLGFVELTTMECLQKELQVQTRNMPIMQLEFLKEKRSSVEDASSGGPTDGDGAEDDRNKSASSAAKKDQFRYVTAMPPPSMPGHTGYLTAASLPPRRGVPPPVAALAPVVEETALA